MFVDRCPSCGEPMDRDADYCRVCGEGRAEPEIIEDEPYVPEFVDRLGDWSEIKHEILERSVLTGQRPDRPPLLPMASIAVAHFRDKGWLSYSLKCVTPSTEIYVRGMTCDAP